MIHKIFLQHAAILPCKDYKRSEFDYADFYYQRYLLNLPNYFQPFSWLKGSIRSVALCAPEAVLRDDALCGQVQGATYDAGNIPETVAVPRRNIHIGRNYFVTAQTLPIYEIALQYTGPVILVHGTADRVVPYTYSERYKNGYKNAELYLLPGVDHGFSVNGSTARGITRQQFLG